MWGFDLGEDSRLAEVRLQNGSKSFHTKKTIGGCSDLKSALTVFLFFVRAVTTVVDGVTQLMAVDAAVVLASETEWRLTLDVH